MKYKVGDQIKIIAFPDAHMNGKIGVVIAIPPSKMFIAEVRISSEWCCFMYEGEIEPYLKVGEQLLFEWVYDEV